MRQPPAPFPNTPAGPPGRGDTARVDDDLLVAICTPDHAGQPIAPCPGGALLAWVASGEAMLEERLPGGPAIGARLRKGEFCLRTYAPQADIRWIPAAPCEAMHVLMGPALLAATLRDVAGMAAPMLALRDVAPARDDVLHALLELLHAPLRAGTQPCGAFLRGLGHALAAHVVRRYAASPPCEQRGLPGYKLERVLAAMHDRLGEPFDLAALARQADLSVFHFSRAFKLATGMSPSRYFVRLRMEEARRMLCATGDAVIDIALALGYRSPSHFSQVFRDATGVSPTAYRAGRDNGAPLRHAAGF